VDALVKIAELYPVFRVIEIEEARNVIPKPIEGMAHPS
jgi:hypothetical protein